MSLSRRERREFAKRLGLLGKKENIQEMIERFNRSKAAGEVLHTHHLQEIKNIQLENSKAPEDSDSETSEEEGINPFGFLGKK